MVSVSLFLFRYKNVFFNIMKYCLIYYITIAIVHRGFAQDEYLNDNESLELSDNDAEISETQFTSFYTNPRHCPENMIAYSGPGGNSPWICGCMPRFLYFSLTNSCYEAFSQGPCPRKHYLHLAIGSDVPRCVANPCIVNGFVPYEGKCYRLKKFGGPCANNGFLYINERTFQIECTPTWRTQSSANVIVKAPPTDPKCPPDTRPDPDAGCKIPIP